MRFIDSVRATKPLSIRFLKKNLALRKLSELSEKRRELKQN
jgi:hypothetical protein